MFNSNTHILENILQYCKIVNFNNKVLKPKHGRTWKVIFS